MVAKKFCARLWSLDMLVVVLVCARDRHTRTQRDMDGDHKTHSETLRPFFEDSETRRPFFHSAKGVNKKTATIFWTTATTMVRDAKKQPIIGTTIC